MRVRHCLVAAALCSTALAYSPTSAKADVTSVDVEYSSPFGTFGTRTYTYAEGTVSGTVANAGDGTYRVPFVLIYPDTNPNGYGIVDLPQSAFFEQYPREDACQDDLSDIKAPCANGSFHRVCETRGDFLCQEAGSVPMSDNRYEQQIGREAVLYTEDYLFEQGYTYISVQYSKAVTEHFGDDPPDGTRRRLAYGTIEFGGDEMEIIKDASRFLRDPSTFVGGGLATPAAVNKVVSFGFSGPALTIHTFFFEGHNVEEDDSLVFDGVVTGGAGAVCERHGETKTFDNSILGGPSGLVGMDMAPTYSEIFGCPLIFGLPIMPTGDAKLIAIQGSAALNALIGGVAREFFSAIFTDVGTGTACTHAGDPFASAECGALGTGAIFCDDSQSGTPGVGFCRCAGPAGFGGNCAPDPNYRLYEIAGVAHVPTDINELSWLGTAAQNPADPRPVYRAMFHHMHEWIENDTEPPAGVILDGTFNPADFSWTPDVDADNNELGGIRLPHMPRVDGSDVLIAGAPLGVYGTLDFSHAIDFGTFPPVYNLFALIGGTFSPFDDIATRYPGDTYATLVEAAADELLAEGYILQEDHDRYLAGVDDLPDLSDIPDPDPTPEGETGEPGPETGGGCGCSVGVGAGSGLAGSFALLFVALFGFRRRKSN